MEHTLAPFPNGTATPPQAIGTFAECVARLFAALEPDDYQVMAKALDVSLNTIKRWATAENEPVGIVKHKLINLLEMCGFQCLDFHGILPEIKQFRKYLVYELLSVEEATKALDYTDQNQILRLGDGRSGISSQKLEAIKRFLDNDQSGMVQEAENDFIVQASPIINKLKTSINLVPAIPSPKREPTTEPALDPLGEHNHETILLVFANLVKSMKPLAEMLLKDDFTEAERTRLREMCGYYGIFRLKNSLARLCGEDARGKLKS